MSVHHKDFDEAVEAGGCANAVRVDSVPVALGTQLTEDEMRVGREQTDGHDRAVSFDSFEMGVSVASRVHCIRGRRVPHVSPLVFAAADDVLIVRTERGSDVDCRVGEALVLADK